MKDLSESRVLIVDDDRSSVDLLVEALRRDYKLSVALNGQGALGSIRMSPPDLVLLDSRITLRPGDSVLLYTTGVTKVTDASGEPFGESRFVQRLERSPDEAAGELLANLLKGLQNHIGDCPQSDDYALLAIRRTG